MPLHIFCCRDVGMPFDFLWRGFFAGSMLLCLRRQTLHCNVRERSSMPGSRIAVFAREVIHGVWQCIVMQKSRPRLVQPLELAPAEGTVRFFHAFFVVVQGVSRALCIYGIVGKVTGVHTITILELYTGIRRTTATEIIFESFVAPGKRRASRIRWLQPVDAMRRPGWQDAQSDVIRHEEGQSDY